MHVPGTSERFFDGVQTCTLKYLKIYMYNTDVNEKQAFLKQTVTSDVYISVVA